VINYIQAQQKLLLI